MLKHLNFEDVHTAAEMLEENDFYTTFDLVSGYCTSKYV